MVSTSDSPTECGRKGWGRSGMRRVRMVKWEESNILVRAEGQLLWQGNPRLFHVTVQPYSPGLPWGHRGLRNPGFFCFVALSFIESFSHLHGLRWIITASLLQQSEKERQRVLPLKGTSQKVHLQHLFLFQDVSMSLPSMTKETEKCVGLGKSPGTLLKSLQQLRREEIGNVGNLQFYHLRDTGRRAKGKN